MNQLFPYQEAGVQWLAHQSYAGLFDEQGLGKTVQGIVAADRVQAKRLLVVSPTVVVHNWAREIRKWSARKVQVITASNQRIDPSATAVVVTHGMLLKEAITGQLRGFDLGVYGLDL